jgi:site-specific DNA-cytosine methylase
MLDRVFCCETRQHFAATWQGKSLRGTGGRHSGNPPRHHHRGVLVRCAIGGSRAHAAYTRWVHRAARVEKRAAAPATGTAPSGEASVLKVRSNIALGRIQDAQTQKPSSGDASLKGILNRAGRVLNVVELFSGAGGMGLGFLLGGGANARYRIVYSGEANPIFVASLRSNHRTYERITPAKRGSRTPPEVRPVDLRESKALRSAAAAAREAGDAQVLIGGPPCQGFSIANKNSWSGENPHNELIDVFIDYIAKLSPLVFLMENVQGILWTPKGGPSLSLVDHAERRMKAAGYRLFPKLLDAVWYGVPQHRTRFFLLGLHQDLGYSADSFGDWGPFPTPTHGPGLASAVTVRSAISDLPRIGNGHSADIIEYSGPSQEELSRNSFLQYLRDGDFLPRVVGEGVGQLTAEDRKEDAGANEARRHQAGTQHIGGASQLRQQCLNLRGSVGSANLYSF